MPKLFWFLKSSPYYLSIQISSYYFNSNSIYFLTFWWSVIHCYSQNTIISFKYIYFWAKILFRTHQLPRLKLDNSSDNNKHTVDCRDVRSYLKLGGQVVIWRADSASNLFYSTKTWLGNFPSCSPISYAPDCLKPSLSMKILYINNFTTKLYSDLYIAVQL
jgi:hypothetical protein